MSAGRFAVGEETDAFGLSGLTAEGFALGPGTPSQYAEEILGSQRAFAFQCG